MFLPGQREIARVQAGLQESLDGNVEVLALHGELPVEQQARVLQAASDGRRRVVLATNVAESSVTLPGVRVVIDSGQAREPRYDNSGFTRLDVVAIAQASADQRAAVPVAWPRAWPGGCGRSRSGWSRSAARRSTRWNWPDWRWNWPRGAAASASSTRHRPAMGAARELLQRLGALSDSGAITALGRRVLALGTHPRMAAMLLAAPDARAQALAADLAALLEARDPLRQGGDALAARWRALAAFRTGRAPGDANRSGLAAIDAAAKQWRRRLRCEAPPASIEAHELGDLLAHAFPDRIGFQHPGDPLRYLLANGRSAPARTE